MSYVVIVVPFFFKKKVILYQFGKCFKYNIKLRSNIRLITVFIILFVIFHEMFSL